MTAPFASVSLLGFIRTQLQIQKTMDRLALVSLPPFLYYMPSIQIGSLKAFINQQLPKIEVDCYHLHLGVLKYITPEAAYFLSENIFFHEGVQFLVYEQLQDKVFSNQAERIEKLEEKLAAHPATGIDLFTDLVRPLARFFTDQATIIARTGYDVVGVSVGASSIFSSMNLTMLLNTTSPATRIILGGSGLTPNLCKSLGNVFDWIDSLCFGEGETGLLRYLTHFRNSQNFLCSQHGEGNNHRSWPKSHQISDLNRLPAPDYDEYFVMVNDLTFKQIAAGVVLPIEGSRGCWHQSRSSGSGCRFCSLNLQWKGYRAKSLESLITQVTELSNRYPAEKFLFVDNTMVAKIIEGVAVALSEVGLKVDMIETRPNLKEETISKVASLDISRFYVGIEALDTESLLRMNKGVSLIPNIYVMKLFEQYHIKSGGCIMFNIPGTTAAAMQELNEVIRCVKGYRPLFINYLLLNEGSDFHGEMMAKPEFVDSNHKYYWDFLPEEINRKISFGERNYLGPIHDDSEYAKWQKKARNSMLDWTHHYWRVKKRHNFTYLLWLDWGGQVHDLRNEEKLCYQLSPRECELFKSINKPVTMEALLAQYDSVSVESFIHTMALRRLVYTNGSEVLGLPIILGKDDKPYRDLDVLTSIFSS